WRHGEPAALDDLVRVLSPVLWQVVRAYGLSRERSEDIVQVAWLTFVRRSSSIEEPSAVASWLTTTARREAWRAVKSDGRSTPVLNDLLEHRLPEHTSAESEVVASDEHDRLWSYVSGLSPRCQRLLRIVAFEDRPNYAQIATDMDMPVGSIGPTRARCLSKLRAALANDDSRETDDD